MRTRLTAIALIAGTAISAHAADAHLPLTNLTLYRSGVGSFTHVAAIEGSETFELTFDTNNVDDILKSLLLLDTDPNATSSVSYQSSEDLGRRLGKFSININQAAGIDDLFAQLRGVELTLTTPDATVTGTILGVESRNVRRAGETESVRMVNVVTPRGIRSFAIDDIVNFEFTDDEITDELNRALQTLVDNRTDNLRDMAITFTTNSTNRRNVAVSYVHEMPVWKTAYRLVIPRDKDTSKDAKDKTLTLQAWAIIENTTAADWTDVQLSLAAGRPVSFTMNLDEAIYANRPNLPVPIGGSLSAMLAKSADMTYQALRSEPETSKRQFNSYGRESAGAATGGYTAEREFAAAPQINIDNLSAAQSSGGQEGGLFLFTLDEPLNLASQQSAMLPIANTAIEGEPISVYNASVSASTPFLAVRLTNDTGLHLMPGPVTIFDGERYAGDAQTDHIARGGDAQLTYAADLDLNVSRTSKSNAFDIAWSINDGLLIRKSGQEITWTYTAKNSDATDRTLVIDHAKAFGTSGTIIAPKDPSENRESTISRELEIEAGDTAELVIRERKETATTYRMGDFNIETVIASATEGSLSEKVITALRTVAAKRQTIANLESAISRDTNLINEIIRDQSRIRSNMSSLDHASQLYRDYYATLSEQEQQLKDVRRELELHRDNHESAQQDLRDYLNNLTIE